MRVKEKFLIFFVKILSGLNTKIITYLYILFLK